MDNVLPTPYTHQVEGISFLENNPYALLADDMGLGKTMQAIIANRKQEHILVICPAHLQKNWEDEIRKTLKTTSVTILNSKKRKLVNYSGIDQFNIISYGKMKYLVDIFQNFDTVIIDEAHELRIRPETMNTHKQSYRYLNYFLKHNTPERVHMLTGTPILNHVGEFYYVFKIWSQLPTPEYDDCLKYYSNPQYFLSNFCVIKYVGKGIGADIKVLGSRNEEELQQYLSQRYLRRNTEEVIDLPPIITSDVPTDESTSQDKNLLKAWKLFNEEKMSDIIITAKLDSAINKVLFTVDLVKSLNFKKGVIVWTEFKDPAYLIDKTLKEENIKSLMITGDTNKDVRKKYVKMFQDGEIDVLVCTIMSMNTGHTITRASSVVFNDLHWTPAQNTQALKRANRIGSTKATFVYYVIGSKIDMLIRKTLARKEYMINQVV